jgi:predicted NBD/HSP70 family sugar kinase
MEKATRQQIREHNLRLVLRTIYQQGTVSRAEIARLTCLTRATVSEIVAEWMRRGLVSESGTGASSGGKPPIFVRLERGARQIVSLDLSGTSIRGALMDLCGGVVYEKALPFAMGNAASSFDATISLAAELVEKASAPVLGMGVGCPGLVDSRTGRVNDAIRLGFVDQPLGVQLAKRFNLPVYVINDGHAAALAEYTYGRWRGAESLAVIKIGAGIGAGFIYEGRIHFGDGYSAGEIGHLVVNRGGRLCGCGNRGCLETVASISAVLNEFYGETGGAGELDRFRGALQAGDLRALSAVQKAGEAMGKVAASMAGIVDIHRLVFCGDAEILGARFLETTAAEAQQLALPGSLKKTELVFSTLGADIVLLGVSALVLSHELGLP